MQTFSSALFLRLISVTVLSLFVYVSSVAAFPNLPTLVFPTSSTPDGGGVTRDCSGLNQTCPQDQ